MQPVFLFGCLGWTIILEQQASACCLTRRWRSASGEKALRRCGATRSHSGGCDAPSLAAVPASQQGLFPGSRAYDGGRCDNDQPGSPGFLTEASLIELRDKDSNQLLGTIGDDDLRFLVDELEEESPTDQDYYFDAATVDMLEEDGAPASLVSLLRQVLGAKDGMEIRWERQ